MSDQRRASGGIEGDGAGLVPLAAAHEETAATLADDEILVV